MYRKIHPAFSTSVSGNKKEIPFLNPDVNSFISICGFSIMKALYFKDSSYLDDVSILECGKIMPQMEYFCPISKKQFKVYYYIYFLMNKENDIVYIGQTKCRDRVCQHVDKKGGFLKFAYIPIFQKDFEIQKTEKQLIVTFCPLLNKKHLKNENQPY